MRLHDDLNTLPFSVWFRHDVTDFRFVSSPTSSLHACYRKCEVSEISDEFDFAVCLFLRYGLILIIAGNAPKEVGSSGYHAILSIIIIYARMKHYTTRGAVGAFVSRFDENFRWFCFQFHATQLADTIRAASCWACFIGIALQQEAHSEAVSSLYTYLRQPLE